jgi:hypothetical protein
LVMHTAPMCFKKIFTLFFVRYYLDVPYTEGVLELPKSLNFLGSYDNISFLAFNKSRHFPAFRLNNVQTTWQRLNIQLLFALYFNHQNLLPCDVENA